MIVLRTIGAQAPGPPGAPALIGRHDVAHPILADRDPPSETSDRGSREIPIASVIRVIRANLYREPELYPKLCKFGIVRCNLREQPYRLPIACRSTPLILRSAGNGGSRDTESQS